MKKVPMDMGGIRQVLAAGCQMPGCDHKHGPVHMGQLVLGSRCHPGKGVRATARIDGVIVLDCQVCGEEVVQIRIAESLETN